MSCSVSGEVTMLRKQEFFGVVHCVSGDFEIFCVFEALIPGRGKAWLVPKKWALMCMSWMA